MSNTSGILEFFLRVFSVGGMDSFYDSQYPAIEIYWLRISVLLLSSTNQCYLDPVNNTTHILECYWSKGRALVTGNAPHLLKQGKIPTLFHPLKIPLIGSLFKTGNEKEWRIILLHRVSSSEKSKEELFFCTNHYANSLDLFVSKLQVRAKCRYKWVDNAASLR